MKKLPNEGNINLHQIRSLEFGDYIWRNNDKFEEISFDYDHGFRIEREDNKDISFAFLPKKQAV